MKLVNRNFDCTPLIILTDSIERKLIDNNIPVEFTPEISVLSATDLVPETCNKRLDLRKITNITIDCDDTKDMDDAVYLQKTDKRYKLSISIADVAAYVIPGSIFETVAMERGTSIYMPHKTIPMLPEVLSNQICSLNPHEERNAVTVNIELDFNGKILEYEITKSLITSRVKGNYSEINAILDGSRNELLLDKYSGLIEMIFDMQKLAGKLRMERVMHGADMSIDTNLKFNIRDNEIDLTIEDNGAAGLIIEEFMVLANHLVAQYFKYHKLPFIYRAQAEKGQLAKYVTEECGHATLALDQYTHFTSPIRRLADLKVHQVLTAHLNGVDAQSLWKIFGEDMIISAERATRCENRSDHIYHACNRICTEQFLAPLQDKEFSAEVIGHNHKNCPIFLLNKYQIRIIGKASQCVYKGLRVFLKLIVDFQRGGIEVVSYKHVCNINA